MEHFSPKISTGYKSSNIRNSFVQQDVTAVKNWGILPKPVDSMLSVELVIKVTEQDNAISRKFSNAQTVKNRMLRTQETAQCTY